MASQSQPIAGMRLLPAKPGTCVQCATEHGVHDPHNWWSLFYQMRFQLKWGRWPTHADCVGHLPKPRQRLYQAALAEIGREWSEPADTPACEPYARSEG